MQGIELVAIFSLLSSLLSLFSALSSLLCPVLDSRNRILAFSQGNMRPRSRPPRRNAAIRHVLGANKPCSELSCAIDGAPHCLVLRRHSDPHPDEFFLIEMLPHLISANLVAEQLLLACLLQMLLLNLHVMFVVIVLLFNFLYNADESFKDMDPLASGRRSHTLAGTVHCW